MWAIYCLQVISIRTTWTLNCQRFKSHLEVNVYSTKQLNLENYMKLFIPAFMVFAFLITGPTAFSNEEENLSQKEKRDYFFTQDMVDRTLRVLLEENHPRCQVEISENRSNKNLELSVLSRGNKLMSTQLYQDNHYDPRYPFTSFDLNNREDMENVRNLIIGKVYLDSDCMPKHKTLTFKKDADLLFSIGDKQEELRTIKVPIKNLYQNSIDLYHYETSIINDNLRCYKYHSSEIKNESINDAITGRTSNPRKSSFCEAIIDTVYRKN